ncbi:MAG: phosphoenolpyruvate--protein phosphotransferase [Clostridium sp.]|nr:phosphoenolpyruvate--protein phosphotransferase [Clostridium sp.]
MEVYQGKSVFGGVAIGRLYVYNRKKLQVKREHIEDVEKEVKRFLDAKETAIEQLAGLYKKSLSTVGESDAAVFEIHQMMLQDNTYIVSVESIIRTQQVNAEYAVSMTGNSFADKFEATEDNYIKERAADMRDVSERMLAILSGQEMESETPGEERIIVAEDLSPSETVQLDKDKVLSFVTLYGSTNSHTAILARMMGIPALVGTPVVLDSSLNGKLAAVDGDTGEFFIEPDEQTLQRLQKKYDELQGGKALLQTLKGRQSVTLDGRKIMLYANIGNDKDIASVLENDAEGIGLFRSEFLYLERDHFPTEEEQFEIYRSVVEAMAGKRVVIRTLDIGADKQTDYLNLPPEQNPAIGCRAIRFCLSRPEIFKTQLRALFRASAYGKLDIMYPMITSLSEIIRIKRIVEEVKSELAMEKETFGNPAQGIMIETPAAAMISDVLAKEVDFFSIGTNDLAQYALALDRQNAQLDDFYEARHQAVLRMIAMTVENAHKANIPCGICGELGADEKLNPFFLALGVDELSMSPGNILPIRKIIRETNIGKEEEAIKKRFLCG